MIKDTDKQPDKCSGRVPGAGASVHKELGCIILPVPEYVHQLGGSQTPYYGDFYGGFIK